MTKAQMQTFLCGFFAVVITWYINHEMGYGALVANGLVGVLAAIFLPGPLAGAAYAASFVGMSGLAVIPSMGVAALGGVVVGIVLVFTGEIYAGVGGKGGTTAALSVQITRFLANLIG
ncbi:hypothetical protein SAMN05660297_01299 [Natronincola peptidivorans]|uniref:Uncharacterized protein n=1 Tax=Natronincola peptidivorans TaxID=426128 RepID=A0A1I0BJM3_9FIRM|nr:hypothetical protein [Natronincola peptidivorans]SET07050.1 hypothetical protein SAMN05660297_01299 [Natronincola peptidivorans]